MGQTIAEALREEGERRGELKARRHTLLLQLRRKFGTKVTSYIVANIHKTKDVHTLDEWLGRVVEADALEEVGIPAKK